MPTTQRTTYLLTYLFTYSMQQGPSWEVNRFVDSQEIPLTLWNPKIYYRIHKCPPPVPILSQLDPVHTPTSHFVKILLNIILPSTPGSPKWSLSPGFPTKNPVYASPPHTCYMPGPSQSPQFYHPNNICWAVQIITSSLCSFLHYPVTSSLLGPNILLITPFSDTLSLRSSLGRNRLQLFCCRNWKVASARVLV